MARCPHCRRHFRVMEDEDPADHGCPNCGYGQQVSEDREDRDESVVCAVCGEGADRECVDGTLLCAACFDAVANAREIA